MKPHNFGTLLSGDFSQRHTYVKSSSTAVASLMPLQRGEYTDERAERGSDIGVAGQVEETRT